VSTNRVQCKFKTTRDDDTDEWNYSILLVPN